MLPQPIGQCNLSGQSTDKGSMDCQRPRSHGKRTQHHNHPIVQISCSNLTVNWNGHPVLLFADMDAEEYVTVWQYQFAKAVTTLRQNVSMGLKKGNTVLLHFSSHGVQYQTILMMSGSVPGGKGGESVHNLCYPA